LSRGSRGRLFQSLSEVHNLLLGVGAEWIRIQDVNQFFAANYSLPVGVLPPTVDDQCFAERDQYGRICDLVTVAVPPKLLGVEIHRSDSNFLIWFERTNQLKNILYVYRYFANAFKVPHHATNRQETPLKNG
jgi:hypothetical protein